MPLVQDLHIQIGYRFGLLIFLLLGGTFKLASQKDSLVLNEYSIGVDYQSMNISSFNPLTNTFNTAINKVSTQSLSFRMQSSLLERLWKARRKLIVADFLASELNAGNKSLTDKTVNGWLGYRFEFGASLVYRLNRIHQFGFHLILLKFTHTGIMGNVSGSGIVFRYKYKHLVFEPALESQVQVISGWFYAAAKVGNYEAVALQGAASIKYQNRGKVYGIRADFFPINNIPFEMDYIRALNGFSIRAFVGICF